MKLLETADLAAWASAICGDTVPAEGVLPIGGSGNSRVYRVETSGKPLALKHYHRQEGDPRDRQGTEFAAFQVLRAGGITCVPEPIAMDRRLGTALYSFLEGALLAEGASDPDVRQAVTFLGALQDLARRLELGAYAPASFACFNLEDILTNLVSRRKLLSGSPPEPSLAPEYLQLQAFLDHQLEPAMGTFARQAARAFGPTGALGIEGQTFGPSDFAFHNAIRQPEGGVVFFDFEYFGREDPVKIIADFILHPRPRLQGGLKELFRSLALDAFPGRRALEARLERLTPLFGLSWCLIILNEFTPTGLARRQFAAGEDGVTARRDLLRRKLTMARELLNHLQNHPRDDPWPPAP